MAKGDLASSVTSGLVTIAALAGAAWVIGFEINPMTMLWIGIIFSIVAVAARRGADLEVGFVVIGGALLLAVNEYLLPDIVSEAFAPFHQALMLVTGIDLSEIEPITMTIVLVSFVFVMIYLRYRISGEKKFADTTTDKTLAELANYARRYITIGRLAVFFAISVIALFMSEIAELSGAVGELMAGAPVVVSNLWAIFLGFTALDGEIPMIGEVPFFVDVTATGFFILGLMGLLLAVASRWSSSGPLNQFITNR